MASTITITAAGITVDNLVAGAPIAVTASGLVLAENAALAIALTARMPDALVAMSELAEGDISGTFTGTLHTATREMGRYFFAARADERRMVSVELLDTANRALIARVTVPIENSALLDKHADELHPLPGGVTPGDVSAMISAALAGLTPEDIGAASIADATLNGRGVDGSGFSEWTVTPDTYEGATVFLRQGEGGAWTPTLRDYEHQTESPCGIPKGDGTSTSLTWSASDEEALFDIAATRSALPGYVLGSQTQKPLPKLSDVPAVVAPSTAAADAGKAADAKDTGEALAGKLPKTGGTITGQLAVNLPQGSQETTAVSVGGDISVDNAYAYRVGNTTYEDGQIGTNNGTLEIPNASGTLALADDIPAVSAETWTFTLSGGGTITKSVAVYS